MKVLVLLGLAMMAAVQAEYTYRFPEESDPHEGTWLQWPHAYEYGPEYRDRIQSSWVEMTKALQDNENVHIIAYDEEEKKRIIGVLEKNDVTLKNVDFHIYPTEDVWVRDNGPIFVKDSEGNLLIQDWGFNGWGKKHGYKNMDKIPTLIGRDLGIKVVDLNEVMVNEGGSVESDGQGVLMACKSSVIDQTDGSVRNKGMNEEEAEEIFKEYYGLSKVIWLDGVVGEDVTDMHIDGFMTFVNHKAMVTMSEDDLAEFGVNDKDIETLYAATNAEGEEYEKVKIPLTKNNVILTNGTDIGYKGSYANYYVANKVVLVPNYKDPNDDEANKIIQKQYLNPKRTVVGIDVRDLYANGGMIHCVTQQQPAGNYVRV